MNVLFLLCGEAFGLKQLATDAFEKKLTTIITLTMEAIQSSQHKLVAKSFSV
jgi:hypothetical protein